MLTIGMLGVMSSYAVPERREVAIADDFEAAVLAADVWNRCQLVDGYWKADVSAAFEGKQSLMLRVAEALPRNVQCDVAQRPPRPFPSATVSLVGGEDRETLGPSLVSDGGGGPLSAAVPCDDTDEETSIQRNEVRIAGGNQPKLGADLWYGFAFKMSGHASACRTVVGQWKHYGGKSPFLAQRYDRGLFHVTVQDGDCRCRVTQLASDRNFDEVKANRRPLVCKWTPAKDLATDHGMEGEPCTSSLRVDYGEGAILPDPGNGWVNMAYRVRGGPEGTGLIEIHADGQLAARVTGPIGYWNGLGQLQVFKLGIYRNDAPGEQKMNIDRFRQSMPMPSS